MANDVTVMLDALFERKLTLDDVVARFRGRSWADASAGTYDDVVAAYDQGRLDDMQYGELLEAVAEAQSAEAGF
ncbi:MAG TPA: hypothetical protein VFI65_20255 [Streptosporangiaceae bacterium]|nr:hypothetical protein [Streptosporangiaceae bacterium]